VGNGTFPECRMVRQAVASERVWITLRHMICVERARNCATIAGENWNKFNSCLVTRQCRPPNDHSQDVPESACIPDNGFRSTS
jgi:hypothetical protein